MSRQQYFLAKIYFKFKYNLDTNNVELSRYEYTFAKGIHHHPHVPGPQSGNVRGFCRQEHCQTSQALTMGRPRSSLKYKYRQFCICIQISPSKYDLSVGNLSVGCSRRNGCPTSEKMHSQQARLQNFLRNYLHCNLALQIQLHISIYNQVDENTYIPT